MQVAGASADTGRVVAAGETRTSWPWSASWPLAMLTLISVFNYLDRSLLGLALPAIKEEMAVSDTALGLVSGLAFVVIYSLLGIPIAWLADRYNRRNIIAIGLAFWSAMTAATGWVSNIWQLAATRFLMGAGEASSTAPANSMIADLFPASRRPLALALYGTAATIAYALFFPIAGWIAENYGWRAMFMAAGVPGLALAIAFYLTVREPERHAPPPDRTLSPSGSMIRDLRALFANRCFVWIFAGVTFMGANVWATGAWTPTFFARVHGLGMTEAAAIIGPSRGILGAAGILAGGFIVDRLRRGQIRWRVGIPALACAAVGPAEVLFLLGESTEAWFAGFALASFFTLIHQGPIYAAVVNIVEARRRALAIAVVLLGASLVGNVIGPSGVGILNDALAPRFGDMAIRYSLMLIAVSPVIAALCFWRAAVHYPAFVQAGDDSFRGRSGKH
jgi:MFS family permease